MRFPESVTKISLLPLLYPRQGSSLFYLIMVCLVGPQLLVLKSYEPFFLHLQARTFRKPIWDSQVRIRPKNRPQRSPTHKPFLVYNLTFVQVNAQGPSELHLSKNDPTQAHDVIPFLVLLPTYSHIFSQRQHHFDIL